MRRIIISIIAALVLLSVLFFLVDKNILKFENSRIKDLVGKSVESEYVEKVELAAISLERKFAIEDRKLDFLLKDVDLSRISSPEGIAVFREYVSSQEQCEQIRLINRDLELVYSTSRSDVTGTKLNQKLYGGFFSEKSTVILDPPEKRIIFSKSFSDATADEYRALFYYDGELLKELFKKIKTLDYRDSLIANEKLILLNFPEITTEDEENIQRFMDVMSEKQTGAIRVIMRSSDVTVYYDKLAEPYKDIKIGLAVASEKIGLSRVGIVILVSQSIVVLSLLIFLMISVRQKRGIREKEKLEISEKEKMIAAEEQKAAKEEPGVPEEEALVPETGVISLSDVEEVSEVEEIGEAEVAEELEELEEFEEGERIDDSHTKAIGSEESEDVIEEKGETLDNEKKEPGVDRGKNLKYKPDKRKAEGIQETDKGHSLSKIENLKKNEKIEDNIHSIGFSRHLPELDKLVKKEQTDDKYSDSRDVRGEEKETDKKKAGQYARQKVLLKEPQKEKEIVIPDDFYKEKGIHYKDDELAHLIDEIEQTEQSLTPMKQEEDTGKAEKKINMLKSVFNGFLNNLALSKAAILVKDKNGVFSVAHARGLSESSIKKLKFDGGEQIYKQIIAKGKLLYIKKDAFLDNEIRSKFDIFDASKIRSLFFAPVIEAENIKGITIVCITTEESLNHEILIKEIKRINKILLKYI